MAKSLYSKNVADSGDTFCGCRISIKPDQPYSTLPTASFITSSMPPYARKANSKLPFILKPTVPFRTSSSYRRRLDNAELFLFSFKNLRS
jgi:hypothetical protein